MTGKTRREQPAGPLDALIDEVDEAARVAVRGEELAGDIDWLVDEVGNATRAAVVENGPVRRVETLVGKVDKAVRAAASGERPRVVDAVVSGVVKAVRSRGSEVAESMTRGRETGRDNVVMVRVTTESQQRMDDLVEAGLWRSRSEAAAFLIAEGIKARQGLFDGIASKIDAIRKAKEELRRLLDGEDAQHA